VSADAMRGDIKGGGNPVESKRQDRAGARSFGILAARYIAEHSRRRKRSHASDERNLRKHVLPRWQDRLYVSIKRGDVIELVEGLVTAGKPTLANRVQSLVSSIFSFGLDAGLIEAHPCYRLRKRGTENVGQRILSDLEIQLLWHGIIAPAKARRTGLGLRLALLTGARVGEIAGLCRAELHLDDPTRAVWLIPGTRTKNGRDHLIPLSALARHVILDLLGMIGPAEQFLFPTRSLRRAGPMRGNSLTQAMTYFSARVAATQSRQIGDSASVTATTTDPIESWSALAPTPHDLRRTLGTRLAELRVHKEIRDRVLNHMPSDVGSKHYNAHDYSDEKRDALERWASVVTSIIEAPTGAAVVSIATEHNRAGE
jgi:integrase